MKTVIKRVLSYSVLFIILYSCFSVFTDLANFCLFSLVIPTLQHIIQSVFQTCWEIIQGPLLQIALQLFYCLIGLISCIKDCFFGLFSYTRQSKFWIFMLDCLRYLVFIGVVYTLLKNTKIRNYEDLFSFLKYFFLFVIYWAKEYECPICHQKEVYTKLKCGHRFHLKCIDLWNYRNGSCPYCRTLIIYEQVQISQRFKSYLN